MNEYVNLYDFKRYRGPNQSSADDDLITAMLGQASRFINQFCNRRFDVRLETRYFDHPARIDRVSLAVDSGFDLRTSFYGSGFLKVDDDLLAVTQVLTSNGETELSPADYFLMCGNKYNLRPFDRISLNYTRSSAAFDFVDTPQRANHVTGWWGYNENYPDGWADTLDSLQEGVSAAAGVLTVSNSAGPDSRGQSPRFKVLQTLKVGDELMHLQAVTVTPTTVTDPDTQEETTVTTHTLTVRRGINGTTAAAHDAGAAIYTYEPMPDIVNATRRLANWLYMQKDSQTDNDRPILTPAGVTILPNKLPGDIATMLVPYISPFGAGGLW